jgi:rSAM/selenodomain-associated transferase 1
MLSEMARFCAIGVMAKTPQPGRSKTRLCPPLQPDQAAALSAAFLRDTTEMIAAAGRHAPITAYAAYAPPGMEAALQRHLAPGTTLVLADGAAPMPPGVDGFGRCLLHAMQGMFALGHGAACVLSSDTPTLPVRLLVQAAEMLLTPHERGRAVLGACDDGGYYLLGVTAAHAALFTDIAWSTGSVAEATRDRAHALGLELIELEPWYDVDDAASLARLITDTEHGAAPWTQAALDRMGLRAALSASAA